LRESPPRLIRTISFSAAYDADEIGYDFVRRTDRLLSLSPGFDGLADHFGCGQLLAAGDSFQTLAGFAVQA